MCEGDIHKHKGIKTETDTERPSKIQKQRQREEWRLKETDSRIEAEIKKNRLLCTRSYG